MHQFSAQLTSHCDQTHHVAPQRTPGRTFHPTSTTMKHALHPALIAFAASLSTLSAHAHEGHGMPGVAHWHSTDVLGFLAAAVAVGAAVWFKGRK